MKVNNKALVSIIIISIVAMLTGVLGLIFKTTELDIFLNTGAAFFILTGTYLLINNGKFIYSKEYRFSMLSVSISLIGILFKIMHWKFSALILAIGFLSLIVIYFIYLVRRFNSLNWNHWFKLLFLLLFLFSRYFTLMHWRISEELTIGALVILLILVIDFILKNKSFLKSK